MKSLALCAYVRSRTEDPAPPTFFFFPTSSGSRAACAISALFFLAAEKPSVVQERACMRRPWLVRWNWWQQGPLVK